MIIAGLGGGPPKIKVAYGLRLIIVVTVIVKGTIVMITVTTTMVLLTIKIMILTIMPIRVIYNYLASCRWKSFW